MIFNNNISKEIEDNIINNIDFKIVIVNIPIVNVNYAICKTNMDGYDASRVRFISRNGCFEEYSVEYDIEKIKEAENTLVYDFTIIIDKNFEYIIYVDTYEFFGEYWNRIDTEKYVIQSSYKTEVYILE